MYDKFQFILGWIKYFIGSKHYYGHGIHSPFIYQFSRSILFNNKKNKLYKNIHAVRKKYKNNKTLIFINDFGAGSRINNSKVRKISKIVRSSSTKEKYGKILFRIIEHYNVKTAIEIGTSLGIGTLYMAISQKAQVHTIEGDKSLYKIAKATFTDLKLNNITTYNGLFNKVLPDILKKINQPDLVYFDGNHTREATLFYFNICLKKIHNETIFIFDDIHWSKSMEQAWEEIKAHPKVKVSIDLFQMGIIFFRKELTKQHFIIKY